MSDTAKLQAEIKALKDKLDRAYCFEVPRWAHIQTPLTSTSWDGDAYSTTAKTKIDLSAVFGVPAGVKAVIIRIVCRDSGSATDNTIYVAVAPNDTAASHMVIARPGGLPADYIAEAQSVCTCDANGDIYYQIDASGSGTMDVWLEIWDYEI